MSDHFGVVWTRVNGAPMKLADMVMTTIELRITKTPEAVLSGMAGVSLLHDKVGLQTVIYPVTPQFSLPPQLEALLPPKHSNNAQRILLSRLLARQVDIRGMPIHQQDWAMLMFAGRNATGHLDVFRSDQDAQAFYQRNIARTITGEEAGRMWYGLKRVAERKVTSVNELEEIADRVGPTPGVSGFATKMLTRIHIESGQWHGAVGNAAGNVPAVVKIESDIYPGLLALEALCYSIHGAADLRTPRHWLRQISVDGVQFDVLATERFDRVNGLPLPMESVFCLLRTGSPAKFYSTTDGNMETAWQAVEMCSVDVRSDRQDFFKRFVLSFLTGNGDLHTENWAMLGSANICRLSPVYDPAPMRAYRAYPNNHDLLSALPFNNIGGADDRQALPYALSNKTPADLRHHLVAFAKAIGLSAQSANSLIDQCLDVTRHFTDQAGDILAALPAIKRKAGAPDIDGYLSLIRNVRQVMGGA